MRLRHILQEAIKASSDISSKRVVTINGVIMLDILALASIFYSFYHKTPDVLTYSVYTMALLIAGSAGITAYQSIKQHKNDIKDNSEAGGTN